MATPRPSLPPALGSHSGLCQADLEGGPEELGDGALTSVVGHSWDSDDHSQLSEGCPPDMRAMQGLRPSAVCNTRPTPG